MVASGYQGIWATENTREALFDAMMRKETYATTGSRMMVRFFGGWEFEEADAQNRLPANVGYTKGVPMGADLPPAPSGGAPSFLVAALKDPISGNLDRIQHLSELRENILRRVTAFPDFQPAGTLRRHYRPLWRFQYDFGGIC